MKKLTKIQLVNWHFFAAQTIEIKNNALISGENGVGKSTLLDALQYLLIGGKSGVKFNIAANENAKRSLEGYIRGKIGAENKQFLRNKDVVTHLAIEFYDTVKKEKTIIGCVLELSTAGFLKDKFYLCSNFNLTQEIFITNQNQPRTSQQMSLYLQQHYSSSFIFFDSKKQYQTALSKYLQIDILKYLKMLPKALAFKPLNLQHFVFDFLLEENPINITSLKNNVQQLKKIEMQIETEKKKLQKLTSIMEIDQQLKQLKNQKEVLNRVIKLIEIQKNQNKLNKIEIDSQQIQKELKNYLLQKKQKKLDLTQINSQILQLQARQIQNNRGIVLYNLQQELEKNQIFAIDIENQISIWKNKINEEIHLWENMTENNPDPIFEQKIQEIKNYLQQPTIQNMIYFEKQMQQINTLLEQKNIDNNIKKNDFHKEITLLKNQLSQIQNDLDRLTYAKPTYPTNVFKLITLLRQKLKEKYNQEVFVYPLCELIETKEELWRNAIEGFLGARKFNLIIDMHYFQEALQIYAQFQAQEKIYDVGIVNIEQIHTIHRNTETVSLADKITTQNNDAWKYSQLLLAHVICETDINRLKQHKTAITPQGMIYSNYTAKQLNPKTYQFPYIGINSKQIRQKVLLGQRDTYHKDLTKKQNKYYQNETFLKLWYKSQISSLIHISPSVLYQQLTFTQQTIATLQNQIIQSKKDPDLIQLESQLNDLQLEKTNQTQQLDQILKRIAESENKDQIYQEQIKTINQDLQQIQNQYKTQNIIHLENQTVTQFHNYQKQYQNNDNLMLKNIQNSMQTLAQQTQEKEMNLKMHMSSYIDVFHLLNIEPQLANLDFFVKEYDLITYKNLINYEQESKELSRKVEIIFKEEFIIKLKESFQNIQQQIKNLNKLLKNRPFGNDSYQIIVKASEEPQYKKYYTLIMEEQQISSLSVAPTQDQYYKNLLLEELFQKVINYDKEYASLANAFLDYRNYLNYDIQIKDQENNISLFSKIFREKSGGETQVPFYIILSICFEQLLVDKSENKGCLVLFDEAFNNMDENRIDAMMLFLNSLKIQFFIAIPPQRIPNITPHVTTNLVIIKEHQHAFIETFTREL